MAQKGIGTPAFETKAAIEQDIERLHQEIKEKRGDMPEKEALHEAVRESIEAAQVSQTTASQPTAPSRQVSRILPTYVTQSPKEVQLAVEKLIAYAFEHGITKAVKEAKGQGPFFIDAFHDALTDKLYQEFQRRKLFK